MGTNNKLVVICRMMDHMINALPSSIDSNWALVDACGKYLEKRDAVYLSLLSLQWYCQSC